MGRRGSRLRVWLLWTRADRRAYRRMSPLERQVVWAYAVPPALVARTRR